MTLSIYIHIPFCQQKCYYCDFISFPREEKKDLVNEYLQSLAKEIEIKARQLKNKEISTIYIGGGTPSVLTVQELQFLLTKVKESFYMAKNVEYTIEGNPDSLNKEKLQLYKSFNVNRLSLGLQSITNQGLKSLGRTHTYHDFLKLLQEAIDCDFFNISADLIFPTPGQSLADWQDTLRAVTKLPLTHFSLYNLKIEENTPFFAKEQAGKLELPSEDEEVEMFSQCESMMQQKGYLQYEISNYSLPDFNCQHNLVYWLNKEYIGLGLAAHSYYNEVRFANTNNLKEYITQLSKESLPIVEKEKITLARSMEDAMILGLRLIKGVEIDNFTNRYGSNPLDIFSQSIKKMIDYKLLEINKGHIRLTKKAIPVANNVFIEFLSIIT